MMNYREAVGYLYDIPRFAGKATAENTKKILTLLGSQEKDLKLFHVAGSNGKGSVCAFIDSILREAGFHRGLFTSPHLVKPNERIKIDGMDVSDEEFTDAFNKVYALVADKASVEIAHPSFFEFIFLMALLIFKKKGVVYAVMETGLGGRLDATNVIGGQIVSVITSISLEHTEILGDTIEKIAYEKAGIIKPGVPVVYDKSEKRAEAVILRIAAEKHSACYGVDFSQIKNIKKADKKIDFSLDTGYYDNVSFTVSFPADYQMINAALAANAFAVVRERLTEFADVSDECIIAGIEKARWEGRMECVKLRDAKGTVYMDGAHNVSGIEQFVKAVKDIKCSGRRLLLFGAVGDKDYENMAELLMREVCWSDIYVTALETKRTVGERELAELFKIKGAMEVYSFSSAAEAFKTAASELKEEDMLCVAGSLYLIGEVKKHLQIGETERN